MSGNYFPNNLEAWNDMPEEFLHTPTWEEFEDWKLRGWQIPSSVCCIIRAETVRGKVKEYVYSRPMAAKKKLEERMQSGEYEFTVCNGEAIHLLTPMEEDYDDPLA